MKPDRRFRMTAGFTLIEMVITVTLLGVLLAIAVPSLRQLTLNQGVKSAAFDLFSALEYGRSEAIKRPGEIIKVKALVTTGKWQGGWILIDGAGDTLRSWTPSSSVVITGTDAGGNPVSSITFGKDGHVSAPATSPKWAIDPTTTTNGVESRCVQLDLIGRPKSHLGGCT